MSNEINNSLNNCCNLTKSHSTTYIPRQLAIDNKEKLDNSFNSDNNTFLSLSNLRLQSPKSIKAMKILGMTKEELFRITFDEYKRINPDILSLPIELQYSRFEFYESHRKENIKLFLAKKQSLLNDDDTLNKTSQLFNSIHSYIMDYVPQGKKRMVNNEIRRYERLENKNKAELMLTIQNAIKNDIISKEIEKKNQLDYQRNMNCLERKRFKLECDNKQTQLRNELKQKELELDILKKKQEHQENVRIEQEKNDKNYKKQQKTNGDMIQKSKEDAIKRNAYIAKVTQMKYDHIDQIQSEIDAKENSIQRELFKKRLAQSKTQRSMMQLKQDLQLNFDIKHHTSKNSSNTSKEYMHCSYYSQRYNDDLHKTTKVGRILQANQKLFNQKLKETIERERNIRDRAELNELNKLEEKKKHQRELYEKRMLVQQSIQINEEKNKENNLIIMRKFENKEDYIQKMNETKQKELMLKKEAENRKLFLKKENIRMLVNRSNYKQEIINMEILEKRRKICNYTDNKNLINAELKKMQIKIAMNKQKEFNKLEKVLKTKSLNIKAVNALKELYPDKKSFDVLMNQWKGDNSNNKYRYEVQKTSSMSIKSTSQKEIEQKIKEHRDELSQELKALLKKEREIEEEREKTLENERNKKEKIALEKLYSLERAEASEKIALLKE